MEKGGGECETKTDCQLVADAGHGSDVDACVGRGGGGHCDKRNLRR